MARRLQYPYHKQIEDINSTDRLLQEINEYGIKHVA